MSNQKNSQYGYVNINGRLVPTTEAAREHEIYYTKEEAKPNFETKDSKEQKPKRTYAEINVERKMKKDEIRKKGIKNLSISLALFLLLSSAKQLPFNINAKVTEVASNNSEHSYMDELFASNEKIEIINPRTGKKEKIQLEDAADKLEDYIEICTLINRLNIDEKEYTELTAKEQKQAIELYNEKGIEGIIELYKNNKGNDIEKARTSRQLIFIRNYFGGDWLEKNGLNIAKELLTKTIQTGAIENYGTFEPSEYNVVEIPSGTQCSLFAVKINDPVSGATDDVTFIPLACGEYAQAILLSRKLNNMNEENLTPEEKQRIVEHTLRIVKKCINKDINNVSGITYTINK